MKITRWQIFILILIGLPYFLGSTRQICCLLNRGAVTKVANIISVLLRENRQYQNFLSEMNLAYKGLLIRSNIRRLNWRSVFRRFFCVLDKVWLFLNNELLLFHELCGVQHCGLTNFYTFSLPLNALNTKLHRSAERLMLRR